MDSQFHLEIMKKITYFNNYQYGQLGIVYNNRYIPTLILTISNITQISSGALHSLFLNNGSVYSFGMNDVFI